MNLNYYLMVFALCISLQGKAAEVNSECNNNNRVSMLPDHIIKPLISNLNIHNLCSNNIHEVLIAP